MIDRFLIRHQDGTDFAVVSYSGSPPPPRWVVEHGRSSPADDRPVSSTWTWVEGGRAVVLRRMPDLAGNTRNDVCHGLVGNPDDLSFRSALAFAAEDPDDVPATEWTPDRLLPWHADEFRDRFGPLDRKIEQQSQDVDEPFLHLLATLLLRSANPLAIAGPILREDGVLLLGALDGCVGALLIRQSRAWTFSSFETMSDRSIDRLPRVHVLSEAHRPSQHYVRYQEPVSRATPVPTGPQADAAWRLVEAWYTGGRNGVASLLDRVGALGAGDWKEIVRRLADSAPPGATPAALPSAPVGADVPTAVSRAEPGSEFLPPNESAAPKDTNSRPTPTAEPTPMAESSTAGWSDADLVRRLTAGRWEEHDRLILDEMSARRSGRPGRRLYLELIRTPDLQTKTANIEDLPWRYWAQATTVQFCLPGQDLADPSVAEGIAGWVADPRSPQLAVDMVVDAFRDAGHLDALFAAYGVRHWRQLHDRDPGPTVHRPQPAVHSEGDSAPLTDFASWVGSASPQLRTSIGIVILLVAMLVFAVGALVG